MSLWLVDKESDIHVLQYLSTSTIIARVHCLLSLLLWYNFLYCICTLFLDIWSSTQEYYFYDILSRTVDWTAESDTTSLQWSENLRKIWGENRFDSEIREIGIATSFRLEILTKAIQVTEFSQLKLEKTRIFSWQKLFLFERRCNSEEEKNWLSRMINTQKRRSNQKKSSSDFKTCKKQTVKARIKERIRSNVDRSTRNDVSFSSESCFSRSIRLSVVHQIKEEKRKASWSVVTTAKERKKNFDELRSKNKITRSFWLLYYFCYSVFHFYSFQYQLTATKWQAH